MKLNPILLPLVSLLLASESLAAPNSVVIDGSVELIGDWDDEICLLDIDGADDNPGQKDATYACIASNFDSVMPADLVYLRFDFDSTSVNGNNTLDGCWLLDKNGNMNADLAVCFTLGNSQNLVLQSAVGYDCNDTALDNCPGSVLNSVTAICQLDTSASNTFNPMPADLVAAVECSVGVTDLGLMAGDNVDLLSACSFPSAIPNSAPSDCVNDALNPFTVDTMTGNNATPVDLMDFSIE